MKELLKWLRANFRDAEASRKKAASEGRYGDAQIAEGLAQAYAYTIMHVKRLVRENKQC